MSPDNKRKSYTLGEIAERIGGGKVEGDASVLIEQVATLEHAVPRQISFLTHGKYRKQLSATKASAVILGHADADATTLPRIICDNPYAYFAHVSALLNPMAMPVPGIHSSAVVEATAQVASSASIAAFVSIGKNTRIGEHCVIHAGCVIGDDVTLAAGSVLYPQVVIYHNCVIGERVILHAGVVIGSDGFGIALEDGRADSLAMKSPACGERAIAPPPAPDASGNAVSAGRWLKIPQIGRVVIGNDVEIGANTTVDRGALDDTVIEEGVKLDNQIQVAHNVRIGAHTAIAGCVGIAGSAVIGRHCKIGGAAMILGHLKITDHVDISTGTLITKSIDKPGAYTGVYPFAAHVDWLKNSARLRHLDELAEKLRRLDQELEQLKGKKS